jgi:potassium efflux system protein
MLKYSNAAKLWLKLSIFITVLFCTNIYAEKSNDNAIVLSNLTQANAEVLQSAKQELQLTQQRNDLLQQRLARITASYQQAVANLKPADVTTQMVDRANLDASLAAANVDSANITLAESQQANDATAAKISTLQTQLQNITLAAGKANAVKQKISALQDALNYQKTLLKWQQKELNELTRSQTLANQLYLQLVNWKNLLEHLSQVKAKQAQQQALQQQELQLEAQQKIWLDKLASLDTQLQASADAPASNGISRQRLELQILQAQEQSNLVHLQLVLLHLQEQVNGLEQQQLTTVPALNAMLSQLAGVLTQCSDISDLITRKQKLISLRNDLEKKSFQESMLSAQDYQYDNTLLKGIADAYQTQANVLEKLTQQTVAYQITVQQQLNKALARRQGLPGFSMGAWKAFGHEIMSMPVLALQTLIALKDQVILAYGKLSVMWASGIVAILLVWVGIWFAAKSLLRHIVEKIAAKRNDLADNLLYVLLTLLLRNFAWVLTIVAVTILLLLLDLTVKSFAPLLAVMLVWFVFKIAIDLARLLLVETAPDPSGRDIILYRELKYGLLIGGVLTMLTVLAHNLPVGYEVADFFNRLFMLFMLVISLVLLRGWKAVPGIMRSYVALGRPYLMRVITLLSLLVPLTIFSTALIGFLGYVDFAWTISRYEGLFLLVISVYILLRGFWNDIIEWTSELCIRHFRHGWLLTQAFLKPLDNIVKILLFLSIFVALFYLYGLTAESFIVRLLKDILHFHLLQVKNAVITPLTIIKFIIAGAIIYWLSRWTREIGFRWIFARSQDLGVRNSLAAFSQYTVVVIGSLIALQVIGLDLTGISYVLGGLAFGAAFGLRDLVKNYASGLLLLIERPVRTGDLVSIGTYEGEVTHIGMRSMTVKTWDHVEVLVPNSETFDKPFTNWTHLDSIIRTVVSLKISREDDPNLVRQLIADVLKQNPYIVADPAPQIYLMEMDDALMRFEVRYFINLQQGKSRPAVRSDVLYAVYEAFKKHNIKPPHQPQDIYLHRVDEDTAK